MTIFEETKQYLEEKREHLWFPDDYLKEINELEEKNDIEECREYLKYLKDEVLEEYISVHLDDGEDE